MTDRVVLAYSGGLDTSVAISWIGKETGAEVVAVAIDLGQGGEDMEVVRQRALDCGAVESIVVDARDEFADEYCLPTSRPTRSTWTATRWSRRISRPLIVKHLVEAAAQHGADHRRARLHRQGQRPGPLRGRHRRARARPEVIAPVRDYAWTRDKAIAFAEQNSLPIDVTKKSPFSIDQNVWGRAVETGFLEDLWNAPTKDVYEYTADPTRQLRGARRGDHHASTRACRSRIDGRPVTVLQAIQELNTPRRRAGRRPPRHGRGPARRHQEPRGLRGARRDRADHRAPGARERHPRARARPLQAQGRAALGELVYDGLWFSPLKDALDVFVAETQEHVTGDIRLFLHGGAAPSTAVAARAVALRLQPGHLRRGRHVRPVARQGLRRDPRPVRRRSPPKRDLGL